MQIFGHFLNSFAKAKIISQQNENAQFRANSIGLRVGLELISCEKWDQASCQTTMTNKKGVKARIQRE